jgi:serine/threonine-protein kinase
MMAEGGSRILRVSQRQLRTLLYLAALLPQLALGQELFGSFAYSEKGRKYGWANNYPTREAAQQAALDSCRKSAPDCQVALWFRNACGALVTGPGGHGAAWAESETAAVNRALKSCAAKSEGCALTRAFCTGK